ncbi:class I SAM-dependent methyltransferase [Actinoplanes sp. HUAS TT8]|uniref:class I SAM-dependent methyltransferase n=1 Tax=Actinoplanes sp. HUAS TT8 TaxID=3447453 RepID=UPI003F527A96
MFSPQGPSLRELCVQALTSVERGYDFLAPKFDHTPFRTPADVLEATVEALSPYGPFDCGLDVCCGTGAGLTVLDRMCREQVTGVDFSAGMLDEAHAAVPGATLVRADARALPFDSGFDLAVTFGALGHFLPSERPAFFDGVHRALRPGGLFAVALGELPARDNGAYWSTLGFDLAMLVRNAVVAPSFVMYYRTATARSVRRDLRAAGFTVDTLDLTAPGDELRFSLLLGRKPGQARERRSSQTK